MGRLRSVWRRQRFVLTEHPDWLDPGMGEPTDSSNNAARNQFICLRIGHHARNNLGADVQSFAEQQLGKVHGAPALPGVFQHRPDASPQGSREAGGPETADVGEQRQTTPTDTADSADFYHNRLKAIAAATPYRPATSDGHGQRRHPKPTVHGAQTAIVVGHPDQPIDTDRDHRVQVQYHWQRGSLATVTTPRPAAPPPAPGHAPSQTTPPFQQRLSTTFPRPWNAPANTASPIPAICKPLPDTHWQCVPTSIVTRWSRPA